MLYKLIKIVIKLVTMRFIDILLFKRDEIKLQIESSIANSRLKIKGDIYPSMILPIRANISLKFLA